MLHWMLLFLFEFIILLYLNEYLLFDRVRAIMEKDALKDPKTNRNAANARILLPEVCTTQFSFIFIFFVGLRLLLDSHILTAAYLICAD